MIIQQESLHYQSYIDWIIGEHEKQKEIDYFEFVRQEFIVKPTVFNPNIATSSKLFAEEILKLNLTGKQVLDAGCGSGILSIAALKAGASFVYAFDINPAAVETTEENLSRLGAPATSFQVEQSDGLPKLLNSFDYIFFNPPFFDCKTDATWKRSVCDIARSFYREVVTNAKNVLHPSGSLVMMIGGELDWKCVQMDLLQLNFSNVESKSISSNTSFNLHLIAAQVGIFFYKSSKLHQIKPGFTGK
jgi:methylase of polypeptide subunit release factors